jgi:2-amino-4-hydroxy-6-hydroxymethyldihydropteridine diphosphokinase
VYETEPVGVKEAYRELEFLNAVIVLESPYDARAWLARIKSIESAMGRVREEDRNAPRPIDIDILYADRQCIDDRGLTVPHPRWARRRFVLRPLADVRPDLTLPGMDRTVADVLASLPPGEDVRPFADAGW